MKIDKAIELLKNIGPLRGTLSEEDIEAIKLGAEALKREQDKQKRPDNPGLRGKLEFFSAKVRSGFIKEENDEEEINKIIALSPDCNTCPVIKDLEEVHKRRPDYGVASCIEYLKYKLGKP